MNYEEDCNIDETALDVEWLDQGRIAGKWIRHFAYIKKQLRKAEEKKKIIRSELILKANENPEELIGKAKPNAADIEAYYRSHTAYQAAVDELNELMEEVEFTEMAKNEICWTRRQALENLVVLHGQQYFAGPKVPRNLTEEREKRTTVANNTVAEKMRRTKK